MISPDQHRIPTAIDPHTPALALMDGLDLEGKTALITGGYSGIGLETCRALGSAGARVIIPARNRHKAEKALVSVTGMIEIADMDLADLSSVRRLAGDIVSSGQPLHLLINNAGIMACPLSRTPQGWETQFGVNHMGHFALTLGLLPALRTALSSRVVCLSSTGHAICGVDFDDPNFEQREYDKWRAYGQSKSANALFAVGLDAREKQNGIRAFAVHPGGIMTDLQRHLETEEMAQLGWLNPDGSLSERAAKMFKTPAAGASTSIFTATSPLLSSIGGVYCEDCDVANLATEDSPRYRDVRAHAVDTELADQLWELSLELLEKA
ncbi:MAG: oxidoreductase [Ponticaulis sp.]|nr:oxidoreductase [Ponticaulis sp.]|tara:strand:+ start:33576 stop:34547 length:972 start_codon:yes stop_codon:yes gene_type:complete